MVPSSTARIAWKPAAVRLARPRLAQGFQRAALVLALVSLSFEALPALAGAPVAGPLAAAVAWARVGYGLAAACAIAALVLARGVARSIGVAVDKRSFFVGTPEKVRRIPRWQVEAAVVRPPDRATIQVRLGTGDVLRIRMTDEAEARSLAAILAAAPRRRRSDDD